MRLVAPLLFLCLAGCVERLISVRSDPPGAAVLLDGDPVGVTPVEVPYTWYGTRDVTVELQAKRTYILRGRVVDHEGAPVADAGIHQVSSEWSTELGRSDAGGRFTVPLLHDCEVAARKAGHASSYVRVVRVDRDLDIELTLRGMAGTVRGRVHDASGAGIAWATVLVGLR